MGRIGTVFELDWAKFDLRRGLGLLVVMVLPLLVLVAVDGQRYWLSVTFGALMVGLCDPGGGYRSRVLPMATVGVVGAALTAIGFAVGDGPWGWVVAAMLVVTLLAGLAVKYGTHRFFAAILLNIWFAIAVSLPAAYTLDHVDTDGWSQSAAWLLGAGVTIAYEGVVWLARGRRDQPRPAADLIPGETSPIALNKQILVFVVLRALAVSIATAIAFGLQVQNADWMPVATLVAMKPSLQQSAAVAVQRVAGAVIGAVVAAAFLLGADVEAVLVVAMVVLGALAGSLRTASYTWYTACVAGLVLIAMDLPHPTSLADEGRRVLFTFVGVAIAVVVMLLADRLAKRSAGGSSDRTAGDRSSPGPRAV